MDGLFERNSNIVLSDWKDFLGYGAGVGGEGRFWGLFFFLAALGSIGGVLLTGLALGLAVYGVVMLNKRPFFDRH